MLTNSHDNICLVKINFISLHQQKDRKPDNLEQL